MSWTTPIAPEVPEIMPGRPPKADVKKPRMMVPYLHGRGEAISNFSTHDVCMPTAFDACPRKCADYTLTNMQMDAN